MEARPPLKRALGAWDLTFLSVVAIANLNLVPVIAANGPTTVWLWAAALVLFLLPQGITVIELSHRFPGEGGLYIWAKEEFGDFHGFMCGWAYWTTNMFYLPTLLFYMGGILAYAGPPAVAALADNRVFFFMLTVGLLWLTAILNIRGIGVGKWVNNSGGWGTLVGSAVLVVLAVVTVSRRGIAIPAASFAVGTIDWSTMSSFGVICFGLVGLELGPVMGDEIRDPRRSVPRGVLWGGVLAGLVYVSASLALLLAVPQREVKVVQGVLQAVDKMTAGSGLTWLLPVLALVLAVAIAGSTSAWLSGSARIIFVSGIDRYLPKALGKVHPQYATPHIALMAIAVLSSLLVCMSFIGASVKEAYVTLLDLSVVLQMISYLYLYATLARVAFSKSAGDGFFSTSWLRFAAIGGLAATLLGGAVAFVPSRQIDSIWRFELKMVLTCALFLGLAGGLFWYYSRHRARHNRCMPIASINPATGETLKTFEALSPAALDEKIQRAWTAFHDYRKTSYAQRASWLNNAARILEDSKHVYGAIMTSEMGKTLKSAVAEAEKCAAGCRYYAENAERQLADEAVATNASQSYIHYRPIGPVLAVMPWNFPFWQVFRFAAPALMAGNTGLLKHASNVPQCALAIENILDRAGFPPGAFQTLLIGASQTASVLADDRVAAATLTGSEPAGRAVASACGDRIKKTVLELGGSDPFIVMTSADLDEAVSTAVKARTINNGQSCIAAKRFIVADPVYDEFERRFVETMKALKVGDPMAAETDVGPLSTSAIRDELHAQVGRAVASGARLLLGGRMIPGPGYYYEPTVLAGLPRQSPIFHEELFGPVAMLFRVADAGAAIDLANDSPFGLGSSVWTRDRAEQDRFIDEIEAGQVFVNAMVASDPRLPFGGVKRSGYGRELGPFGIREFVNIKTIWRK